MRRRSKPGKKSVIAAPFCASTRIGIIIVVNVPGAPTFGDAMAFGTLSYARRLKQAGVPEAQAEAMADATHGLVVSRFATKDDIAALKSALTALEARIMAAMETLSLRLTVRLGSLIVIGVAVLAAIIKL
jgi:hypothetical protein